MPHPNVFSWNTLLRSYCRNKQYNETLSLFCRMFYAEKPDHMTIPIALKACVGLRALSVGKTIHGYVKKSDLESSVYVGSGLIDLYAKCGLMDDALRMFEEYSQPDMVMWTTIVTGYEQNGYAEEALALFRRMVSVERVSPDAVALVSVVSACAQLLSLKGGRSVHGFLIRIGLNGGLSLVNALLNLYAKTGSLNAAMKLFKRMEKKDVISWASMISCYAHNGAAQEALVLFNNMIGERVEPNTVTIFSALQACEMVCNLEEGKKIHDLAVKKGFELDILVSTSLIDMYMSCSSPEKAVELFERMPKKDAVVWASLLVGCVKNGMAHKAMGVFCDMLSSGAQPDAITMVKILTACSELGILQQVLCLHGYIVRGGFDNNSYIGASLIECYSKCGSLDNAINIFERISNRDLVVWSSMVAGYGIHGQGKEALDLFHMMVNDSRFGPNDVTFLSVLSACSHSGLIAEGIELFNMMVNEYQITPNSKHYGILVDLLGRTGELDKAMDIINEMPGEVGAHVWGALLGACKVHQKTELGEIAARNLLKLDSDHAGYYVLLSNIYAVDGKWDNMAQLRTLIKQKKLKNMIAESKLV